MRTSKIINFNKFIYSLNTQRGLINLCSFSKLSKQSKYH